MEHARREVIIGDPIGNPKSDPSYKPLERWDGFQTNRDETPNILVASAESRSSRF
jgi:hypothetical protein